MSIGRSEIDESAEDFRYSLKEKTLVINWTGSLTRMSSFLVELKEKSAHEEA
jgi:hypothetical protein